MRYDVSALEVLKILGYTPKAMDEWMGKTKIDLPQIYRDFLELTKDCALFQTACLDTGNKGSSEMLLQTLYETMQAEIADWKETWEQEPETRETEIYTFSLLPPVRWSEKVENFLLIGNEDGVVQFGIRMADIGQEDPIVYWNHEEASRTQWNADEKLSDFLLEVLWNVLSCVDYDTAEWALEKQGWKHEEYFDEEIDDWIASEETLASYGIDSKALKLHFYQDGAVFGCYDPDRNIIYTGYQQAEGISLYAISRADTENIFPEC